MGSLLFRELRTRDGFVYAVDSSMALERRNGTFTVSFSSEPKNVDRAQAAAVAIVRRLQEKPLEVEELDRAKALFTASRVLPLDSYSGIASALLSNEETGISPALTDAFWKALLATTPAQVQAAVRDKLRPNRFVRVIVEPGS